MPPLSKSLRSKPMKSSTAKSSRSKQSRCPIQSIFKEIPSGSEFDLPEFIVLDAEIWSLDGTEMVDLLESNIGGPFRIFGTLRIDKDQGQYLQKGIVRGDYQFQADITQYAVDANPDPEVWAGTVCGWLKMCPSLAYREIYLKMSQSVNLLYDCIDLEEEMKSEKRVLKVRNVPFEYALSNGTGLTEESTLDLFDQHVLQILAHVHQLSDYNKSKLYMWLKQVYRDSYDEITEKVKALQLEAKFESQEDLALRQSSPIHKPSPLGEVITISSSSSSASSPSSSPEPCPSVELSTLSAGTPSSILSNLPRLPPLQVLLNHVDAQAPGSSKISAGSLSAALFRDWSLWWPLLAKGLVRLYSSAILERLDNIWEDTPLWDSLSIIAKEDCNAVRRDRVIAAARKRGPVLPRTRGTMTTAEIHIITDDEWLNEAAEYETLTHRNRNRPYKPDPIVNPLRNDRNIMVAQQQDRNTSMRNTMADSITPSVLQEVDGRAESKNAHQTWLESISSRALSRSPSPDPYSYDFRKFSSDLARQRKASDTIAATQTPSQKTLTYNSKAQYSGKVTKLKPKISTTGGKRLGDSLSDDDRSLKRSRINTSNSSSPSPPSPTHCSSPSSSSSSDDLPSPADPAIKPSLLNMARGPLNSQRCISHGCYFIEHNPTAREGQERMLEHFGQHANEDPKVALAKKEASLNRRPVGHLMEKLLKKEREVVEGSGGERDTFGRPYPKAIVRRG